MRPDILSFSQADTGTGAGSWQLEGVGVGFTNAINITGRSPGAIVTTGSGQAGDIRVNFDGPSTIGGITTNTGNTQQITLTGNALRLAGNVTSFSTANDDYNINLTAGLTFAHSGNSLTAQNFTATTEAGVMMQAGRMNSTGLATIVNDGTLNKTGAANSAFDGSFANGGEQSFLAGEAPYIDAGGILNVAAGATARLRQGAEIIFNSAETLQRKGTVVGDVINQNGTVAPGASPGQLTINGDYTQTATGSLNIELAATTPGAGYGQLAVTGNVALVQCAW